MTTCHCNLDKTRAKRAIVSYEIIIIAALRCLVRCQKSHASYDILIR